LRAYVTSENEVTEEVKSRLLSGNACSLSPKTSNIAINIKEVEIENIQNGYSAGNTLRLRKFEYDLNR